MPTVKIYRVSVTGDNHSYVQWTECEGQTPPRQLIDSRVRSITFEAQGTTAVLNSISKSAAATIEMIGDGNSDCSGIGSTLYPTTTTTTTTYAPINFTIVATCNASNTSGTITISSFSGGSGTYSSVAIGNSNGASYNAPTTNLSGATSYQWTGLTNGEWFVTLRDSLGNHAVKSATTGCGVCSFGGGSVSYYGPSSTTTTSTTTTTTTTTTAAPTTTTTTTAAPTTTTTTTTLAPTTTTTTTTTTAAPTTTLPPVEFNFTAPCVSNQANPTILWSSISGGSGVYQASSVVHTSAANALAGGFDDIGNGLDTIYPVITTNGTYYVAVRDKNNISNVTNEAVVITCIVGTTTTTTGAPTTTTAAPATATLYVYAKDVGSGDVTLYAGVNGAAGTTIYDESVDGSMSPICGLIYTFTATLAVGDTVTFSTDVNCVMAGDNSNVCPSVSGGASTFTTAVMVSGQNYVALGMNSTLFV